MALKIVYRIYFGIDVHKTFVVVCIVSANKQGITSYENHRFSTYTKGLKNLLHWLRDRNCREVCMESTGKTGFLFIIFSKRNVRLSLHIQSMLRLSAERIVCRTIQKIRPYS